MKVATILYHKNILSIYKEEWVKKCIDSIKEQTFTDFIIYEINYGDDDLNLGDRYGFEQTHHFYNESLNNHAEAMNFLLDECLEDNIDIVINNNMDDYSDTKRFELQINKIKEGYDIVSSNFQFIDSEGNLGHKMNMAHYDHKSEFINGHNIVCHPSVCYSRNFIENNRYDGNEIPEEDFSLWKRTINDYKFYICPEYLIKYRFHQNQITTSNKIKENEREFEKETERLFKELNIVLKEDINITEKEEKVEEIKKEIKRVEGIFPTEHITVRKSGNVIRNLCSCGEPINKVKYNYCQKCNKLY
jgi:hypothetical protein